MRAKIDRIELSIAVMVKKGERNNQERVIAVIDQYLPRAVKHTFTKYTHAPMAVTTGYLQSYRQTQWQDLQVSRLNMRLNKRK